MSWKKKNEPLPKTLDELIAFVNRPRPGKRRGTESFIVNPRSGCWEWIFNINEYGYGRMGLPGRTNLLAHRVFYEVANGPIRDGLFVCHKCDNRRCVNPSHLFLGTHGDNLEDARIKGRMQHGEARWSAKLTKEDVRQIRQKVSAGMTQKELARQYGVDPSCISGILIGRLWKHVA